MPQVFRMLTLRLRNLEGPNAFSDEPLVAYSGFLFHCYLRADNLRWFDVVQAFMSLMDGPPPEDEPDDELEEEECPVLSIVG